MHSLTKKILIEIIEFGGLKSSSDIRLLKSIVDIKNGNLVFTETFYLSVVVHDSHSHEDILQCVDAGIDVFGTTVKNVIYYRFETVFNLKRTDIVRKPEAFSECLRSFFGERAFHVEAAIVSCDYWKTPFDGS